MPPRSSRLRAVLLAAGLLTLLCLIPARVTRFVKNALCEISAPVLGASGSAVSRLGRLRHVPSIMRGNEDLIKERDRYRTLVIERQELETENRRLRELLGFRVKISSGERKGFPAEVVGRSPAGWRGSVLVNRGQRHGIRRGMPVMTWAGLAGRVQEVSTSVAKVQLVTHPQFRIGALVQRTREAGVVYGTLAGECRMKYLGIEADVRPGDIVETAGFSPSFPKGLPIGEVADVWKEPGKVYQVALIRPYTDLDRLEEVVCVGMD